MVEPTDERFKELLGTIEAIVSEYDLRTGAVHLHQRAGRAHPRLPTRVARERLRAWLARVDERDETMIAGRRSRRRSRIGRTTATSTGCTRPTVASIWLRVNASVVLDDMDEPAFIRTVALDITALKQAEAEREHSHSLLQATLDATSDAILVADLEEPRHRQQQRVHGSLADPAAVARHRRPEAITASVRRPCCRPG